MLPQVCSSTRRLDQVAVGLGTARAPTCAATTRTLDERQLLWAGGDALPDVPEPQFRTSSNCASRPLLHDETNDPRGPVELLSPALRGELLAQYEERGYVVCRGFLSQQQVAECRNTISRIIDDWPERTDPKVANAEGPPFVDLDPRVVAGEVVQASPHLAVRRLFRLATHSEFFRRLLIDETLLDFTKAALGPDLKLIQSMALLKPPGTGEKRWHQDTGVMRLTPNAVLGWWVALDPTDVDNGCMQLWPHSHQRGIVAHHLPVRSSPAAHIYYSVRDPPPSDEVVAVPMMPGDALIFDVSCVHGSGPNTTSLPRWAIQMQYAPSHCRVTHCPEEGSAEAKRLGITKVTRATDSEVFAHAHRAETTPDEERDVAFAPASVFDCECVEPQYWSYRKAEMYVCGRDDFGPDAI
eukprot:COSAG02_NODE_7469_length_2998_cov_4.744740_2_plen_411_part_00